MNPGTGVDGILWEVIWGFTPTVILGLLFWWLLRAVVRADRTERKAYAKMEAEERARRGMPGKQPTPRT